MTATIENSVVKTIDMSLVPPPEFVQTPQFSDTKAQFLTELQALWPDYTALLESDPAMKQLEVMVYRYIINYARTNQGCLAILLAYAKGKDLDQIGVNFDVPRLIIIPANTEVFPPVEEVDESDDEYRHRIQMSWYARNTAGSTNAYNYFSLTADPDVLSAQAYGPPVTQPGHVDVYILSRTSDGTPSQSLIDTVYNSLSPDDTRPLTDYLAVKPAQNLEYSVKARIIAGIGPDTQAVLSEALAQLSDYTGLTHRVGGTAAISGIYDALHMSGVERVVLDSPLTDIIAGVGQAPYCVSVDVTIEVG